LLHLFVSDKKSSDVPEANNWWISSIYIKDPCPQVLGKVHKTGKQGIFLENTWRDLKRRLPGEELCLTEESGLLMSSLNVKLNALCGVVSARGEGKCKGRKAVDFEQGTRVDGHSHHERRTSFPSRWDSIFNQ
jgi:hypothetical protein